MALLKPAAVLLGVLLKEAADRIDLAYQPKPGEVRQGRSSLQVQRLFGTFERQRSYNCDPKRQHGHHPADAALGLEVGYIPGLAPLICLEGAGETTFAKAERPLAQTGVFPGFNVPAHRRAEFVPAATDPADQAWRSLGDRRQDPNGVQHSEIIRGLGAGFLGR